MPSPVRASDDLPVGVAGGVRVAGFLAVAFAAGRWAPALRTSVCVVAAAGCGHCRVTVLSTSAGRRR